jgi:UDP-N-acetyl-D-glucosamine dehydrogenase
MVLESTTYPGTTEEVVLPILSESGLRAGEDFFLCFSPERVDPGNPKFSTRNIPKVIGGLTPVCTELGAEFYGTIMDRVVPVSNPTVAEMVKLLENTFRMINIGLANEMAMMCHRVGVNVWEVIDAAATKPFGFMPFYPGPGLGGHCIPVDPHYLSWKVRQFGHEPRFIQLASEINGLMPRVVVQRVQDALNRVAKPLNGSKVHVVGVAYKRDVSDMRESPAIDIVELLAEAGAEVSYSDPYVASLQTASTSLTAQPLIESAAGADCVLVCTDHSCVDYGALAAASPLIVDTRNVLKGFTGTNIVRL